jgi:hypothetical protein
MLFLGDELSRSSIFELSSIFRGGGSLGTAFSVPRPPFAVLSSPRSPFRV